MEVLVMGLFVAAMGTVCFIQEAIENRHMVKWARRPGYIAILSGAVVNIALCVTGAFGIAEVDKMIPRGPAYELPIIGGLVIALGGLAFLVGMLATEALAKRLFVRYAPQEE